MNSEDVERKMAFIIEQQANFSTDIAELKEQQNQITDHIRNLTNALLSLTNIVERHDEQIAALIEQSKETDARFKETDERINTLVTILDRVISDRGSS